MMNASAIYSPVFDSLKKPVSLLPIATLSLAILLMAALPAWAVDISDTPMGTNITSAAPNIMFVVDDSGSMDWEFMTSEGDGLFDGHYYVFDPAHYSSSHDNTFSSYWTTYHLTGSERLEWKSQWSGYNKIYYNPSVDYKPWPNKTHADVSTPRSNPHNATPTFDLRLEYTTANLTAVEEVVVDNIPGPNFVISSGWGTSTSNCIGDNYHWKNVVDPPQEAKWLPQIPRNGDYDVWVWINDNNPSRDTAAKYTVTYNNGAGTATVTMNQNRSPGWYKLGTWYFRSQAPSDAQSVHLAAALSGVSTYMADAVKFTPVGMPSTVRINNAHYYTWDDADENGQLDAGEGIYLVNFVDSDSNGTLDRRDYYEVTTSGDAVSLLTPVETPPDGIKPSLFNEDGSVSRFKTDAEDLQNFADWFSFYRRRELTAKAAVAHSIVKMSRVSVGIYTINDSSTRTRVLPIKLEEAAGTSLIDNGDSGYYENGDWDSPSSGRYWVSTGRKRWDGYWVYYDTSGYLDTAYQASSRYTSDTGAYARWTPSLNTSGNYDVYAWWHCNTTGDTNAKYTITYDGGTDTVYKDQSDSGSNVCGDWVLLGNYDFAAGSSGSVRVDRHAGSTGTSTAADAVKFVPTATAATEVNETGTLLDILYNVGASGGTPLRTGFYNVGRYFDQGDNHDGGISGSSGIDGSPYAAEADGGACQKAFAIVMTDGYYNDSFSSVGNQDGTLGAPYADSYSNTLADVAMKFYKNDLSSTLSNVVPTNSCDQANYQHLVTYTVSFGVQGSIDFADINDDGVEDSPLYEENTCFLDDRTPRPAWPNPADSDSAKIDDMWHAAINGRGLFFSAMNPEEMIEAVSSIVTDLTDPASGNSVSVNSEELKTDTVLYQARYQTGEWVGDVIAYPIDPISGAVRSGVGEILWQASNVLQTIDWNDRKVITYNPETAAGVPFRSANISADQLSLLDVDTTTAGTMIEFLRGRTDNVTATGFRYRTRVLGDIVHSSPMYFNGTVYAGGNDGMLHAFDSETGRERFAYVPNLVFDNLHHLTDPDYQHKFYVDLTPYARRISATKTLLVGGLGKGGKGYYALNIANVGSIGSTSDEALAVAPIVEWEYPADPATSPDDDLGYTYSQAYIVRSNSSSADEEWVIIFGNGYNSVNGQAMLYVMDLDGNVIRKIDTGIGSDNGLSTPSIIDVNNDNRADYVYAGDLKGNLWKFDLTSNNSADWAVAYHDGTSPQPLVSISGEAITAKPDVMRHPMKHGYLVVFGTGKFLGEADRADAAVKGIYGIWDAGDDSDDREYLGALNTTTGGLANGNGATLLEQTIIDVRNISYQDTATYRTFSNHLIDWTTAADIADVDNDSTNNSDVNGDGYIDIDDQKPNPAAHAGWFVRFPNTSPFEGERVIKDFLIRDGRVFVVSFVPNTSPCSGGGDSFLYVIDAESGGRLDDAQFRIGSPDNLINIGTVDDPVYVAPTGKSFTGMLHMPKIIRLGNGVERLYMSSSTGVIEEEDVDAERIGMSYWLER
ncbi:PQQ-binding-like beta-propeller repeat protein [Desulfuromonas sp. KJ2020]|uniref:PilC/PilY family type IV pilus protein n=1 Tax=Desulfuromonas sp. KJ2020 TaxID=2919173 RepID=UPI0020A783FF|nr:PilC/PilY family type IV pilus protein [Desulfuromonas sp. KJ2020]MCP3177383.1 PQQ-binding-like beta-propeller repeat protein [Desulfuromonas sp. KJ2020]